MAAMRQCEMCDFGATVKCDYCSALVCLEHCENVAVDKGRKEGYIVLQACMACTPEAMRVRSERAQRAERVRSEREEQAEAARGEEDRNNRLALLDKVIADPTTPLDRRAKAHLKVTFIKYEVYILLLVVCTVGIGLLLLMVWAGMCTAFAIGGNSESAAFYYCGNPVDHLLRFFIADPLYSVP